MAGSFDPYDKNSWFFGPMSRQEASDLLMAENEVGVFLVRNSTTIAGDLVLCVREENKVSHYIVNRVTQLEQTRFRIGDQMFPDIPSLLNFYKLHYLDTTPLVRPAAKKVERVKAKYDFEGSGDADDLPFRKGEVLTVISKDEDQWWTARNSLGHTGSIPVPYVEKIDDCQLPNDGHGWNGPASPPQLGSPPVAPPAARTTPGAGDPIKYNTPSNVQRKLPARARVKQARVPNAYDKTALKLEVGDIITVTKTNINGQWEGELKGRVGHFPFTHVEFIDSENPDDDES
ncbi:adapter molecule Crk [Dermacentor andersoni]|uniref:adapter molecule Crk n=1 Tax=Dermacentor andersoni TaxID=34620 RepID=UPI002155F1D2|nr:adapter molecule Crk-like isoform X2 [Dermacentor andersoni]